MSKPRADIDAVAHAFPIVSNGYTVYLQGKPLSPLAEAFMGYLDRFADVG